MKFKMKVQVGVNFPGVGLTKKNKEFPIDGETIEQAMQAALRTYAEVYGQEPTDFATWQLSIAMVETGNVVSSVTELGQPEESQEAA